MAKFELNAKLRKKLEQYLNEFNLTDIDAVLNTKFEKLFEKGDDNEIVYIEFDDLKKFQKYFNEHSKNGWILLIFLKFISEIVLHSIFFFL